ncbi:bacteriohemerythrin [Deltaproteobacteria bacterium TL4]
MSDPIKQVDVPHDDDEMRFAPEDPETPIETHGFWKVLIVDDEAEIHRITRLALRSFRFENKKLEFISAYSGKEARQQLLEHPDTAIVLLDVVMETDNAGLELARLIRGELNNQWARIILRTGQPGQAPEEKVIMEYDINDYRTKTDMTRERLFMTMTTALRSYRDIMTIDAQYKKVQSLLEASERFVPQNFLKILKKKDISELQFGDCIQTEMTVLFSDIRSFTSISEKMTPEENFQFINAYLSKMGPFVRQHHGFIDKYIGDSIMALFHQTPDDAVQAALSMLRYLEEYNLEQSQAGKESLKIGIGINTGMLMLGMLGEHNRMEGSVISDAVNLAARLEGLTKLYQTPLLISEHTFFSLKDPSRYQVRFIDRIKAKGRSQAVSVYEIYEADSPELRALKSGSIKLFEQALCHYHFQEMDQAQPLLEQCVALNPQDIPAQIYLARCLSFDQQGRPENREDVTQPVQWTDTLSTGIPLIDRQHQKFVDRMNQLMIAIKQGRGQEELDSVIHFLEEFTTTHFEDEEVLMRQYDYPEYACHKAQHMRFLDEFNKVKRMDFLSNPENFHWVLQIRSQIVDWFLNHIAKTDRQLGVFLKERM